MRRKVPVFYCSDVSCLAGSIRLNLSRDVALHRDPEAVPIRQLSCRGFRAFTQNTGLCVEGSISSNRYCIFLVGAHVVGKGMMKTASHTRFVTEWEAVATSR